MKRDFLDRHPIIHWLGATILGTLFFGGICALISQEPGVGFAIGFAGNQVLFSIDRSRREVLRALANRSATSPHDLAR